MGFQISQSKGQGSPNAYVWVSQPRKFPGQRLDQGYAIDESMLYSSSKTEHARPQQNSLQKMSRRLKQNLRWPQQTIGRSQPTHQ